MLQMFGQSISGGVDMDGNGYPGRFVILVKKKNTNKQMKWNGRMDNMNEKIIEIEENEGENVHITN